ncbi:low-density lipoprotein receptor class A domain-containing protein 2 [Canis lupus baileyi]|uniref:low-density lipoprotein receptor class A domain-containing protein 2 n=1 Tax=Canis lupus dingo TaxID=286419 RepID=UPI0020C217F9|nr:low-density lipoprotein receptor class A domain-containing protein 2 [Canis lupus dingo]
MEACPLQLLLLGAAALAASALETADLAARCGRTWQGAGLLLRSHAASRSSYFVARDADCALWMRAAAAGDRIRFQFRFFLVYSLAAAAPGSPAPPANPAAPAASAAPADPCAPGSYVQFYEGPPGAPRPLGARVCGRSIPAAVASSGPVLGLRLRTRGRQPRVAFVGEATSFRLGSCGAYFRCQNGRCIPPSLVCDRWGVDNCGDGSDQASWPPANCRGPSLAPSQAGSTDGPPPRPLTLSPALGSAGPLQVAAGRSPLAGRAPEQQDAAAPPGGRCLLLPTCSHSSHQADAQPLSHPGTTLPFLLQVPGSGPRRWSPRWSWPLRASSWASSGAAVPPAGWPGRLAPVASAPTAASVRVLARWLLGGCSPVARPSRAREDVPRGCGFRKRLGSGVRWT